MLKLKLCCKILLHEIFMIITKIYKKNKIIVIKLKLRKLLDHFLVFS